MPQKNTIKTYLPNTYYHVYSRGANKQKIFLESADYNYFLMLLNRYFSGIKYARKDGAPYPSYKGELEIVSFCLMSNHIHLLMRTSENSKMFSKAMSSLMTSYSKFFNQKYKRVGSLFESRYKAKIIDNESYLIHIHRYIHMNPRTWKTYKYSSLAYIFRRDVKWLNTELIESEFSNIEDYLSFLEDYQENKDELEYLKNNLADQ